MKSNTQDSKHIGLRIHPELLEKFRYVAAYEHRSINGELINLICERVAAFEKEHGKIDPTDLTP